MWIGLNWLKAGPSHENNFRSLCSQAFTPVQDYIHFTGKPRPYRWSLSFRVPYQNPVNITVLYVDAISLPILSFCFDYLNNTR